MPHRKRITPSQFLGIRKIALLLKHILFYIRRKDNTFFYIHIIDNNNRI